MYSTCKKIGRAILVVRPGIVLIFLSVKQVFIKVLVAGLSSAFSVDPAGNTWVN
jgi:hypothetical protein